MLYIPSSFLEIHKVHEQSPLKALRENCNLGNYLISIVSMTVSQMYLTKEPLLLFPPVNASEYAWLLILSDPLGEKLDCQL